MQKQQSLWAKSLRYTKSHKNTRAHTLTRRVEENVEEGERCTHARQLDHLSHTQRTNSFMPIAFNCFAMNIPSS